jgi:hypothetical protein
MIDIITCPQCQRRLALPPEHRDCDVQCPGCKHHFRTGANTAPPPPAAVPTVTLATQPPVADQPAPRRPSIARRPPPASPPAWRGKTVLLLVSMGGVAMLMCLLCAGLRRWQQEALVNGLEQHIQQHENAEPVRIAAGVEDPQMARELTSLLGHLARSFRAGDSFQIVAQFDTERAVERLVEQGVIAMPPEQARVREARDQALRHDLQTGFRVWAPQLAWDGAEILHVQRQNADDFAVIVRHRTVATNLTGHFRWWVTRRPGVWSVYDVEDLSLGPCFSALTEVAAEGRNLAELQKVRDPIRKLREARSLVVLRGDAAAADRDLKEIAAVQLPPYLDAIRWAIAALVPMQRSEPKGVLDAVARARALKVDLPVLDLFEAMGHNRAQQHARALPLLEKHNKLLGGNWETNAELGDAFTGLGRYDEACGAYRMALDENPQETLALRGLARALTPDASNQEIEERFGKLNNLGGQFETMSKDCRQRRDAQALERLALAMKARDPRHAPANFALALAKAWMEQGDAAVAAFQAGIANEAVADARHNQTTQFLQAMANAGLARQAYHAAPEPRAAFHTLAAETKSSYQLDDLRHLLATHGQRDPNDPLLPWYQAVLLVERGQYAEADKRFTAALAKGLDAGAIDQFRESRVRACYHLGKALDAYATIGPAQETFRQLALLAEQDGNDTLLGQLLGAHAKAHADDPELYRRRLHLHVKKGDFAAATELFREAQGRKMVQHEREDAVRDFLHALTNAGKPLEAYAAVPDVDEAFERVAALLRGQRRTAELRSLIVAHRKRRRDDLWLDAYTGTLHLQEQKWVDAARLLAEVWPKAPQKMRDRIRSDTVYALYKAGRARDAYGLIEPHAAVFGQLAQLLLHDKKGAELQALIDVHRPNAGDDPQLPLMAVRARVLQNQLPQATQLWQDAYRQEPATWRRREMIRPFVLDMHVARHGMDAYRAVPDRRAAFEALAQRLVRDKNTDELARLLDEYTKSGAKDGWLHFYNGEYRLLIGRPDFAERHFRAALKVAAPHQRWTFRNGLYRAQVQRGQAAAAYHKAGGTGQAFRELAGICQQEKNADQLRALIAAHRAADPDDPTLLSWDLHAVWLDGDPARALALLDANADAFAQQPQLRYWGVNYRVRALVRLKRTAEAIRAAEAEANRGNRVLLLLAYAAAGDAQRAIALMERMPPQLYLVHTSYADTDLGPLLRGDAMRTFRERYPEPPPSAPRFDDEDD